MRTNPFWHILLIATALALPRTSFAAAQKNAEEPAAQKAGDQQIPPAPTHYKGREIARTMSYRGAPWLIRESRAKQEDSDQLLESLELKPGQVVADVGAGNGYYALKMAKLVTDSGRVLAVDIQPEMLSLLKLRAESEGVENIEPILSTIVDPKLPKDSCDLILLVDVYHEFSHPEQMLRAMHASLKPHGQLVLAEFRAEDPSVPIKPLHKMSKEQILKELPPNGFRLAREFDDLPWQHVMFFERDDSSPTQQTDSESP